MFNAENKDLTPVRGLPWGETRTPLMLAPMQGLTNKEMRALFVEWVKPDVVFTEFMRVSGVGDKRLSRSDLREIAAEEAGVPLVVQLVGHGRENLVSAALAAQAAGAVHINLNMGCPFGRMTTGLTGGGMLSRPEDLYEIIPALRDAVSGTFSVKLRGGYDDRWQVLELLPLFESSGVDFLILHPRTVVQKYEGKADHAVTAEVVRQAKMPVIANGDIRTSADGRRVLEETGAAGLMLGRGAIADPLLFERLRGIAGGQPGRDERAAALRRYLGEVICRYEKVFNGDSHVLGKAKGVLAAVEDEDFAKVVKQLRKAKTVAAFSRIVQTID